MTNTDKPFVIAMERLKDMATGLSADVAGCHQLARLIAADPQGEALSTAMFFFGAATLIERCTSSPDVEGEGGEPKS